MSYDNYIEDYVMSLPGVKERRTFDTQTGLSSNSSTYGNITLTIDARNKNLAKDKHSDRIKEIHTNAISYKNTSSTPGQIWVEMDQDDERMSRYLFPDKPDNLEGFAFPLSRDLSSVMNDSINQKVKDLKELLTTKTIAPSGSEWILYGNEKPLYGYQIEEFNLTNVGTAPAPNSIIEQINTKINADNSNYDNTTSFSDITPNINTATIWVDGSNRQIGLDSGYLNIYSYIKIISNNNNTGNTYTYYYVPKQANYTTTENKNLEDDIYYHSLYPRYHIVDSSVNSMAENNAFQYVADVNDGAITTASLGKTYILNVLTGNEPNTNDIPNKLTSDYKVLKSSSDTWYFTKDNGSIWEKVVNASLSVINGDVDYNNNLYDSVEHQDTLTKLNGGEFYYNLTGDDLSTFQEADSTAGNKALNDGGDTWYFTEDDTTWIKVVDNTISDTDGAVTYSSKTYTLVNHPPTIAILNTTSLDYNLTEADAGAVTTFQAETDISLTLQYGDYYKVGRTVWMVSRSDNEHNAYITDHEEKVRSVRLNAIKTKDSLQTKPGQIWVKMNKNDPRNTKFLYPEITPIKWTAGSTERPTVGRELTDDILGTNAKSALLGYINDGSAHDLITFTSIASISDFKFYYDDYILNSDSKYYTINYKESRKLAGDNVTIAVLDFLVDNEFITGGNSVDTSYILNSKTDFDTQNVLMDSRLAKQYGDTYVLLSETNIPYDVKYGDYYDSDSSALFGYKWILTNQTKKLDYGRELYDFDLTNILRSLLPTTITSPSVLSYKAIESGTVGTWYLTTDHGNDWLVIVNGTDNFTVDAVAKTLEYNNNIYTTIENNVIRDKLDLVGDGDYTSLTDTDKKTVKNIPTQFDTLDITSSLNTVFTLEDLDNLNIKSLDYIYVARAGDNEDIYYKAIENSSGVFDGKNWKLIEKGAVPNFGRELYHQNLSDLLTGHDANGIVTLTKAEYDNNNLDKLNLQESDYIIGADNITAYRPMPIYIWLAVRSTENQNVYDKHHQITINDTKNEALDIKQTSTVPGQLWKKMDINDARNSGFYYPVITPLHWVTHDNGATKPEKGRNLGDVLTSGELSDLLHYLNITNNNKAIISGTTDTTIYLSTDNFAVGLQQTVVVDFENDVKTTNYMSGDRYIIYDSTKYIIIVNTELQKDLDDNAGSVTELSVANSVSNTYDLDTFNSYTSINNLDFYYDDYVLNTWESPKKYYTINYEDSRKLSDARLNNHTSKTTNELKNFLVDNNFEGYKENYNYPFDKYYVNIINSTRDSKTNRFIKYGDEYVLLDHRDVPNRIMVSGSPVVKDNNIRYGDFYLSDNGNDIWLAIRSNDEQYAFNKTVDTDIKEIRNTAKGIRRTSTNSGLIWIKMLENDKRMSKYNFENMLDDTSRHYYVWKSIAKDNGTEYWITKDNGLSWVTQAYHNADESALVEDDEMKTILVGAGASEPITIDSANVVILENFRTNTMQPFEKFLKNNIDLYDASSLQQSYIVDSVVDNKTNRITKYGNEYIVFEEQFALNIPIYGQYYLPDDFVFGTKWSLIGTVEPTSGRLLVINNLKAQLDGTSNLLTIDTQNVEDIKINGISIKIQDRLDELELTPEDYILANNNTSYYRPVPPYRWLVSRSYDEEYHYKKVRDIKLKDVLREGEKIRQSSTRIGQIWVVMDPNDERISLTKFPNRRKLTTTITSKTNFPTLLNQFDSNVSVSNYQKTFRVDNIEYSKNTYSVVDSNIDKETYEIIYDADANDRSGLGSTLVLLDTRDIPSLHIHDIDNSENGDTLRYGDYYIRTDTKWAVVMRSYDEQHIKEKEDRDAFELERDKFETNEQSALQNDYQFGVMDDRIGRLWQEVTAVPILDANKKLIEHNETEKLLDAKTFELSREELDTLLSDFTFTKILSTKYIGHRTKANEYYVTTDNGTTWVKVQDKPLVGTQVYHDATSHILEPALEPDTATSVTLTATQLNTLTKEAIDSDFDSNVYDIFTSASVQSTLDGISDGDYSGKLLADELATVTSTKAAILSSTNANKWYLTDDNGANWIVKVNGLDPIIVNSTIIFNSDEYNIFTDATVQGTLDGISDGDYSGKLSANETNTVTNASTSSYKAILSSDTANKWYLTDDNGANWIVKINGSDPILVNSTIVEFDSDNHNNWKEHNKRNRYYTTQYLTDGSNYYISNDYGYNWVQVTENDITNKGSGSSLSTIKMGYEIVHQPTIDILKTNRLLLTSGELDDLLNMAKYASTHGVKQNSDDTTSLLADEYVSHRLLTKYHYIKSGTKYYIPGKYINEDYKNYISFPGKGKLGRYWRLRNINYIGYSSGYTTESDLTSFRADTLITDKAIKSSETKWYITSDNGDTWTTIESNYTAPDDKDILIHDNSGNLTYYSIVVHQETLVELVGGSNTLTDATKDSFVENTKILNKAIIDSGIYYLTTDNGYIWIKLESGPSVDTDTSMIKYNGVYYKDVTNEPPGGSTIISTITGLTFTTWTEITSSNVVTGNDADAKIANFNKFMNILEGNDGSYDSNGNLVVPDPERDSNLEPRLVLTQAEKDEIFGSGATITASHYVQHRVNSIANVPDVYYISQDNGITWQKLTQVSDVSVRMDNTSKIFNFNELNETLGKKIKDKFDENSSDIILSDGILNLDFEDFVNYEVEANIRENSYIVEGVYVFVPGQYVNEEYIYYPSSHEYPSKNDLGRIWMNIGTSAPSTGVQYVNNKIETLLNGFSSTNNNVTTVTNGGTNYEIFSISYQEYANNNVNNISELQYIKSGSNYYIPGRYINDYNDYYPLSPF